MTPFVIDVRIIMNGTRATDTAVKTGSMAIMMARLTAMVITAPMMDIKS